MEKKKVLTYFIASMYLPLPESLGQLKIKTYRLMYFDADDLRWHECCNSSSKEFVTKYAEEYLKLLHFKMTGGPVEKLIPYLNTGERLEQACSEMFEYYNLDFLIPQYIGAEYRKQLKEVLKNASTI